LPLFVVLAEGATLDEDLRQELNREIRTLLSPRHIPDEILVAPGVPRTLAGKQLEVPVTRITQGWPIERAAARTGV
jgi:acetoacetyl-CoA synthetase